MKRYILTLKHDKGVINICSVSNSLQSAINSVLHFENAPEEAIKNIKVLPIKKHKR